LRRDAQRFHILRSAEFDLCDAPADTVPVEMFERVLDVIDAIEELIHRLEERSCR
jgi:hypothetical protein